SGVYGANSSGTAATGLQILNNTLTGNNSLISGGGRLAPEEFGPQEISGESGGRGAIDLSGDFPGATIAGNLVRDNLKVGVVIGSSSSFEAVVSGAQVYGNAVVNNVRGGLTLTPWSASASVHRNAFVAAPTPFTYEATDDGMTNVWHGVASSVDKGNYYASLIGSDSNNDGIHDAPRTVAGTAGSSDPLPLIMPQSSNIPFVAAYPARGAAGLTVRMIGSGFASEANVVLSFDNSTITGATANTSGAFVTAAPVSGAASLGAHHFGATSGAIVVQTPFTVVPPPSKWVITKITPFSPSPAPAVFSVTVQAQDSIGTPSPILSGAGLTLARSAGTGTLGGALNATMAAANDSVTFAGLTYSKSEAGVALSAAGGAFATAVSQPFTVQGATNLSIIQVVPISSAGPAPALNDAPAPVAVATTVTLSKLAGTGTLGGVMTGTIPAGAAQITISGVMYSPAESGVRLRASATAGDALTAGDSSAFTVGSPAPTTVTTVALGTSTKPAGLAVDVRNDKLYIANTGNNTVAVLDGATTAVTSTITMPDAGANPQTLGINSRTGAVWVGGGGLPKLYAFGADGGLSYSTDMGSPFSGRTISVDPYASNSLLMSVDGDAAVNVNTHTAYMTQQAAGNVVAFNTADGGSAPTYLALQEGVSGLAVNPVTNRIYVANETLNTVTVIDGATYTVVGSSIAVGTAPRGVAVNPANNRIYVANKGGNTVTILDGRTNTVLNTVSVGTQPTGVAVNPRTGRVYVSNFFSNSLSIIQDIAPTPPNPTTRRVAGSCTAIPTPCTTTVQDALNAADDGDLIQILAGTYEERVTITKSVTVQGIPDGAGALPTLDSREYGFGVRVNAWNVGVRDLHIIGATTEDPLRTGDLELPNAAVQVNLSARNVTLQNLKLEGNRRGIAAFGENLTIASNTIINSIDDGITLSKGYQTQYLYPAGEFLNVTGNTVTNPGYNGIRAPYADFMNTVSITGNTITSPSEKAVDACCWGTLGPVKVMAFTGNTIVSHATAPVVDLNRWGNELKNAGITSVTISNNHITQTEQQSYGAMLNGQHILAQMQGVSIGAVTVLGNHFDGLGVVDLSYLLSYINSPTYDLSTQGARTVAASTVGPVTITGNTVNGGGLFDIGHLLNGLNYLTIYTVNTRVVGEAAGEQRFEAQSMPPVNIGGITVGDVTVSGNTVNGGSSLYYCCPLQGVNLPHIGYGNEGNVTIGPISVGKMTFSDNIAIGGGGLDYCCPVGGTGSADIGQGNAGTISIGAVHIGDVLVERNQVTGGGYLEFCCALQGLNSPSIGLNNAGNIDIAAMTVGDIRVADNVVDSNLGIQFCCVLNNVAAPQLGANSGHVSIGGVSAGDIVVTRNRMTSPVGDLDVSNPASHISKPAFSGANSGVLELGGLALGNFRVTDNTVEGQYGLNVCCPLNDVASGTLFSGHTGNATLGGLTMLDFEVTGNHVSGGGALEVCCAIKTLRSDTLFSNSSGSTTYAPIAVGDFTVSGNTVANGGGLDVCCSVEAINRINVVQKSAGTITMAPVTVGMIDVSGNTLTGGNALNVEAVVQSINEIVTGFGTDRNTGGSLVVGAVTVGALSVQSNTITAGTSGGDSQSAYLNAQNAVKLLQRLDSPNN
ncbi:MAG: hypothetical protein NTZ05_07835, partial [Chloroflexi bacterium]|nr:hypothetical protein [Chloroflexota bacterium]